MRAAMTQLNLSAKASHRILKLACTIADLAGSEDIQSGRGVVIWTKGGIGLIKTSLIFEGASILESLIAHIFSPIPQILYSTLSH